MCRRSRPHYHSGLEWILGVAFEDTLTRPARLAQGFTHVRCCGSPRASSPHGLAARALASHDGRDCVQLPPARGCYHLAPRRTFTSNPVPMPGTPPAAVGLDEGPAIDSFAAERSKDRSGAPTKCATRYSPSEGSKKIGSPPEKTIARIRSAIRPRDCGKAQASPAPPTGTKP